MLDQLDCRVMTVRQPWASLLVYGLKQYETRPQDHSFRGPVFVVAGNFSSGELRDLGERHRIALADMGCPQAAGVDWNKALPADYDWFAKLPRAAIVGAVRMTDSRSCLDIIEDGQLTPAEQAVGNWADEQFAYRMEHAVAFKKPVPCRGLLGLTRPKSREYFAAMGELWSSCPTLTHWRNLTGLDGWNQPEPDEPAAGGGAVVADLSASE